MMNRKELRTEEIDMINGGLLAYNSVTDEIVYFRNKNIDEDIVQFKGLINKDGNVWSMIPESDDEEEYEKADVIMDSAL